MRIWKWVPNPSLSLLLDRDTWLWCGATHSSRITCTHTWSASASAMSMTYRQKVPAVPAIPALSWLLSMLDLLVLSKFVFVIYIPFMERDFSVKGWKETNKTPHNTNRQKANLLFSLPSNLPFMFLKLYKSNLDLTLNK